MASGGTAAGRTAIDYELGALRYNWGSAYQIEFSEEHGWRAKRRDGRGGWLTAATPDELYEVIRADYALKPVPRDLPARDGG